MFVTHRDAVDSNHSRAPSGRSANGDFDQSQPLMLSVAIDPAHHRLSEVSLADSPK